MNLTNFKRRYDALLPLPDYPGEMNWVLRVNTWAAFVEMGQQVSRSIWNSFFKAEGPQEYDQQFQEPAPTVT